MEFAGCALTAYGPAFSLFVLTIIEDPIRIIILVISAFFWLLALLVSSLFWNFVAFRNVLPLSVVFSVLVQEVFRYCIYRLMKEAEYGLKKIRVPNTNMEILSNKQIVPYVAGLGYGVMSVSFSLGNILAELTGPGTVGLKDPQPFFCLNSAVFAMMFTLLHTVWSIVFFYGVDTGKFSLVLWVVGSHLIVSCVTLVNSSGLQYVSLTITFLFLIATAAIAFKVCRTARTVETNTIEQSHR